MLSHYNNIIVYCFLTLTSLNLIICTDRPIIGVLTQWFNKDMFPNLPPEAEGYSSYISASYIKWIEAAGAQVVPIVVDTSGTVDQTDYLGEIFSGINGLVIPGGTDKNETYGYHKGALAFFNMALEANNNGDIFPIWGTCQGFETLGAITNNGYDYLTRCNSFAQTLPLELNENWRESKLFGEAPDKMIDMITKFPVTVNFHNWCLTRDYFESGSMNEFWRALSTNQDNDGLEFISTMEAHHYPFFGVQFHPEKNSFEWAAKWDGTIPHSREATAVSQYMAEFFVDTARKSLHSFDTRSSCYHGTITTVIFVYLCEFNIKELKDNNI